MFGAQPKQSSSAPLARLLKKTLLSALAVPPGTLLLMPPPLPLSDILFMKMLLVTDSVRMKRSMPLPLSMPPPLDEAVLPLKVLLLTVRMLLL